MKSVAALGISASTAELFGSGYASKGVLRGRYAVPIHSKDGTLLAYAEIAVSAEQQPQYLFHNFDPSTVIFNAHRVEGEQLFLCKDVLQLIYAVENGVNPEEVCCFLPAGISAQQVEHLAAFMDEKKIEYLFPA